MALSFAYAALGALGADAPVLTALAALAPLGLWAAARPFLAAK